MRFVRSFSGLATAYHRFRPQYPISAIKYILEGLGTTIRAADIGCGTGISTAMLADLGAYVWAIEPNEEMLFEAKRVLTRLTGKVYLCRAIAERTGMQNSFFNLVVCAQSFHWFDGDLALKEFHRILREEGRLALLWNLKDNDQPFTAAYSRFLRMVRQDQEIHNIHGTGQEFMPTHSRGLFHQLTLDSFPNPHFLDKPSLIGLALSTSYIPRDRNIQNKIILDLSKIYDQYQENGIVTLMYSTNVAIFRAT